MILSTALFDFDCHTDANGGTFPSSRHPLPGHVRTFHPDALSFFHPCTAVVIGFNWERNVMVTTVLSLIIKLLSTLVSQSKQLGTEWGGCMDLMRRVRQRPNMGLQT